MSPGNPASPRCGIECFEDAPTQSCSSTTCDLYLQQWLWPDRSCPFGGQADDTRTSNALLKLQCIIHRWRHLSALKAWTFFAYPGWIGSLARALSSQRLSGGQRLKFRFDPPRGFQPPEALCRPGWFMDKAAHTPLHPIGPSKIADFTDWLDEIP